MEGNRILKNQWPVYCRIDGRRLGNAPEPLLWTGVVEQLPEDPEDMLGLDYRPCETCRDQERPHWHRYEVIPPDPIVKIVVPIVVADGRLGA